MNDYNNGNNPNQNYYGYDAAPPQPPTPNSEPKNNTVNVVLITVVAVLLVVAIVVGLMVILQNKKTVSRPQTVAPTSASSVFQANSPSSAAQQEYATPSVNVPTSAPTVQYSASAPVASWAKTTVGTVLGSSNINSSRSFGADQAIDGYANTCWCVNTSQAAGAGGTFTVHLKERSTVSGIAIINGNTFLPEESLYRLNGQVRNFTLTFSDGSSLSYTASYNNASSEYEIFNFPNAVTTDTVTFRVDSGYQGDTYTTNVCLGEITVF